MCNKIVSTYTHCLTACSFFDGVPALIFRLILAPVMIIAGYNKLALSTEVTHIADFFVASPDIVAWFGNSEWGLGLPFPDLLAFLAAWTEFLGGWLLLLGLLTRLVTIPLMITMIVAATTVHWHNGWFAIAPSDASSSPATVLSWLAIPQATQSLENAHEVGQRLNKINELLGQHGNIDYLYEKGQPVILNNGIEFAVIYFTMLLSLFFTGGGRFVSLDYWYARKKAQP
ncbi:DoxX family protein [Pseudoalteromonas mariniglutinosa]|uniref:HvfX family Cu-binding RiPP maturation protein n=1 Tax=Pseudoalteromonas mariniglutinosa TaxID=206042 RepID=UPI00384F8948